MSRERAPETADDLARAATMRETSVLVRTIPAQWGVVASVSAPPVPSFLDVDLDTPKRADGVLMRAYAVGETHRTLAAIARWTGEVSRHALRTPTYAARRWEVELAPDPSGPPLPLLGVARMSLRSCRAPADAAPYCGGRIVAGVLPGGGPSPGPAWEMGEVLRWMTVWSFSTVAQTWELVGPDGVTIPYTYRHGAGTAAPEEILIPGAAQINLVNANAVVSYRALVTPI